MNNLMSFQDFIEKSINDGVSLDSNRENLNCEKFEFSPDKISDICEFDASVRLFRLLSQSQIEKMYSKLKDGSFSEQMDIKGDIFNGTRMLVRNYLISRSKYAQFKNEPVNMMIKDGYKILWDAIDSYDISKGNFSQYLFSLFAQKTINDLNNVNLNDNKSVDKYSKDVHENTKSILLRLKGLSIKLFNSKKYYPVSKISSNYSDEQIDNYFDGLDEYKIDVEKGKVK